MVCATELRVTRNFSSAILFWAPSGQKRNRKVRMSGASAREDVCFTFCTILKQFCHPQLDHQVESEPTWNKAKEPDWSRRCKHKQMEPAVVDGSVHTRCKQHERNCPQICVLASNVNTAYIDRHLFSQKSSSTRTHERKCVALQVVKNSFQQENWEVNRSSALRLFSQEISKNHTSSFLIAWNKGKNSSGNFFTRPLENAFLQGHTCVFCKSTQWAHWTSQDKCETEAWETCSPSCSHTKWGVLLLFSREVAPGVGRRSGGRDDILLYLSSCDKHAKHATFLPFLSKCETKLSASWNCFSVCLFSGIRPVTGNFACIMHGWHKIKKRQKLECWFLEQVSDPMSAKTFSELKLKKTKHKQTKQAANWGTRLPSLQVAPSWNWKLFWESWELGMKSLYPERRRPPRSRRLPPSAGTAPRAAARSPATTLRPLHGRFRLAPGTSHDRARTGIANKWSHSGAACEGERKRERESERARERERERKTVENKTTLCWTLAWYCIEQGANETDFSQQQNAVREEKNEGEKSQGSNFSLSAKKWTKKQQHSSIQIFTQGNFLGACISWDKLHTLNICNGQVFSLWSERAFFWILQGKMPTVLPRAENTGRNIHCEGFYSFSFYRFHSL